MCTKTLLCTSGSRDIIPVNKNVSGATIRALFSRGTAADALPRLRRQKRIPISTRVDYSHGHSSDVLFDFFPSCKKNLFGMLSRLLSILVSAITAIFTLCFRTRFNTESIQRVQAVWRLQQCYIYMYIIHYTHRVFADSEKPEARLYVYTYYCCNHIVYLFTDSLMFTFP